MHASWRCHLDYKCNVEYAQMLRSLIIHSPQKHSPHTAHLILNSVSTDVRSTGKTHVHVKDSLTDARCTILIQLQCSQIALILHRYQTGIMPTAPFGRSHDHEERFEGKL